jgi:hypothetical protein
MIQSQNKRGVSHGLFIFKVNDVYPSNIRVYSNLFMPQRIPSSGEIRMLLHEQLSKRPTHEKLSQDGSDIKTISKLGEVIHLIKLSTILCRCMGKWRYRSTILNLGTRWK